MAQAGSHAPPGTFSPGTKVQVGSHRVTIDKYLSEGGFAHVYLVRVPQSAQHPHLPATAVLKRVACPDKDALANMRTEVETMKKLQGHAKIVTYLDSHASQLQGGGYEVFLLMEFCSGGGLIDLMNTRLQHRLTEPEILHIFADVAEGVAMMHYLQPPLLHRDLKVENVLITTVENRPTYKLCDFGSTAPPRPAAATAAEGRLIEDDVQRHTTLQYRSPEMIDVYRKQPIDEKSDIWALGVLLYKLCYYTTPFEELGQMAILNATFKYPAYPPFSDRIKKLIGSMLRENPQHRPNIYRVVAETCAMRHRSVPIKDIYAGQTHAQSRREEEVSPSEHHVTSPPIVGLEKVAPIKHVQKLPEITPMRRGRPTAPAQHASATHPASSPPGGLAADPFAALDSQDVQVRRAAADELAARFPSLDDFSLLHDRGQKFEFSETPTGADSALSMRVVEALADNAFALPSSTARFDGAASKASSNVPSTILSRAAPTTNPSPPSANDTPRSPTPNIQQPAPQRFNMVSTGVQTSPRVSPAPSMPQKLPEVSSKPIWKVPNSSQQTHTMSQSRTSDLTPEISVLKSELALPARPSHEPRSKSQLNIPRSPASSRPSLESQRPSALDLGSSLDRSRSANSTARPVSMHVASDLDYLRDREQKSGRKFDMPSLQRRTTSSAIDESEMSPVETKVRSSVDFLRTIEKEDHTYGHRRGSSHSKHAKRGSITSMVKGRFGDAFRRFEHARTPDSETDEPPMILLDHQTQTHGTGLILKSITGSEATSGTSDDNRSTIEQAQDLSPEVRRQLEREKLDGEERRVEIAAAEYRQRVASQGPGTKAGPSKASTIQTRVKNLLDESSKPTAVNRTADGYGKYTSTGKSLPTQQQDQNSLRQAPVIARKPIHVSSVHHGKDLAYAKPSTGQPGESSASTLPNTGLRAPSGPPPRAPKPKALQAGSSMNFVTPFSTKTSPRVTEKALPPLVRRGSAPDDWDVDTFSKRYPSLSGLEMIETEIPKRV